MSKWYIKKGEQGDVVLSTRIRLARNIEEYPFPSRLDSQGRSQVSAMIRDVVLSSAGNDFDCIKMGSLSRSKAVSLAERHLISPEFACASEGSSLLLTKDESVSIMLCEEDHIRLQVMRAGLALHEAFDIADKLDTMLDNHLHYAFDERIGYLTQCPTNLGTAMRASVMLHLPALTQTGRLSALASTISKLGLTIRGAYGEGTCSRGDIYQLSNQITLGITEQAALDNLQAITMQIVSQERTVAAQLVKDLSQEDKIYRAIGILKSARVLNADEFMELISLVRMGASRGIIKTPIEKINELIVTVQPASINAAQGKNLESQERDEIRATTVREVFKNV